MIYSKLKEFLNRRYISKWTLNTGNVIDYVFYGNGPTSRSVRFNTENPHTSQRLSLPYTHASFHREIVPEIMTSAEPSHDRFSTQSFGNPWRHALRSSFSVIERPYALIQMYFGFKLTDHRMTYPTNYGSSR